MHSIPIIDYHSHPGFAHFGRTPVAGIEIIEEMGKIDVAMAEARNSEEFRKQTLTHWQCLARLVDDCVGDDALRERTHLALANANETMTAYCRWKHKRSRRVGGLRTDATQSCLDQMQQDGAAVINLPDSVRKRLYEMLKAERAATVERHATKPIDRCTLHMRCSGDVFDLAWKTLKDQGLVTAVNDLFGREVNPIYFYLAHNSAQEVWYQDCYRDAGLQTSPFAYAHFDNDFDLAKIQIYLTDVGEDNGPFAFVPGSHRWEGCKTQQYIFKEMDKSFKYPKNESLYYRPRFGCPQHREKLLKLPVPLQGSSHFGDDVVEGSELSRNLAENFKVVTSDVGNCCIFAGGDLLHYGGKVSGADRWVIQFGLAAENPHSAGGPAKRSLLAKLATKSRKYVGNDTINGLRAFLGYGSSSANPSQSEYKPNA